MYLNFFSSLVHLSLLSSFCESISCSSLEMMDPAKTKTLCRQTEKKCHFDSTETWLTFIKKLDLLTICLKSKKLIMFVFDKIKQYKDHN